MKRCTKLLFSLIPILSIAVTTSLVSALSCQQNIGVSFTFNPTLEIVLSSADIHVDDLAPGTVSDSNIVTVSVITNTANGYTLNASVGNATSFASADRNLIHSNTNITDKFTSVDFGSSLTSNTELTDNTWAYAYLDENLNNGTNTTWSNYSGLPLYSDTTNIATLKTSTGPVTSASGDKIKFKIAAKASNTMPSGEYNNVINFTLVATPIPKTLYMAYEDAGKEKFNGYFKMQDMTADICNAAEVVDEASQMQAIDVRDEKVYWITKLQDGKCWMTQNLDHDIVTTAGYYTHENTDLGWGSDTATVSWTPVRATIDASAVTDNTIPNWVNDNHTPYSVDPGDWYWKNEPFYASAENLFLNNQAGDKFQKDTPFSENGTHGHVGNYYNWSAAIAMNDTSALVTNTYDDISANPQNSICPAGWRLPTISSQGNVANSTSEFQRLNYLYNNGTMSTSQNIEAAPLYFVRTGDVYNSRQNNSGSYGTYWSSTLSANAYALHFGSGYVSSTSNFYRSLGYSVRCVAR